MIITKRTIRPVQTLYPNNPLAYPELVALAANNPKIHSALGTLLAYIRMPSGVETFSSNVAGRKAKVLPAAGFMIYGACDELERSIPASSPATTLVLRQCKRILEKKGSADQENKERVKAAFQRTAKRFPEVNFLKADRQGPEYARFSTAMSLELQATKRTTLNSLRRVDAEIRILLVLFGFDH